MNEIELALNDLRAGRMILLCDDHTRENEADLVCAAEKVTPELINFMIREARGLVCLSMTQEHAKRLNIEPMVPAGNNSPFGTNFGVSIEAKEGVTTGISAQDRATTIKKAADRSSTPADFTKPGHVFPLIARPWGVLERGGQTEGSVDLCRMAGLNPMAVICEVLADDGRALRGDRLFEFAKQHSLRTVHIKDVALRRFRSERLVELTESAKLPTIHGEFQVRGVKSLVDGTEHMVIYRGDLKDGVLARVHSMCLTGDAVGSMRCDCRDQLQASLEKISREGAGLVIYLQQEGRGIGLFNKLRAYVLQDNGMDTVDANLALGLRADARDFGIAAQAIRAMGLSEVRLMTNNPDKIDGLVTWGGLAVTREPHLVVSSEAATKYLSDKQNKLGHLQ